MKKKKALEKEVLAFLDKKDQAGVKYRGTAALTKTKNHRPRRKEKDKERDGKAILEKYGIVNSGKVYEEIARAMKGDVTTSKVLQLTTCSRR